MNAFDKLGSKLPSEQQAIRDKCFHPTATFVEFAKEEVEQSIPERFENIVAKYPERIAVKTKSQQLTYDELNEAANRVTRAVVSQRGTGQEPIGLLFPKEVPLIVSILGTLKAGKICVPMDPALPQARLSHILENAAANLILTNHEYLAMANELVPEKQLLDIDESENNRAVGIPDMVLAPDASAFIFYTSGSTGEPKGVVRNHRNALHAIMNDTNLLHICADDRLTFVAWRGLEIFGALLNGAAVFPVNITKEGLAGLANWLMQEEITIYGSVASVFRHFVDTLNGEEQFPKLRLIKLIGEPVYKRDVELYKKHFSSNSILINSIGPTETGPFSRYLVDKDTHITSGIVPVGYPVEDKKILILDEEDREVAVGQTGQIAVRSRYLSPGYWRRPDLTAAAFSTAFSEDAERLYRTGDLGVMRSDGCLTHLGRIDFQVKIRGNRVELAEVEMALLQLDFVKEAVVVTREDVLGSKRLVAYIVPQSAAALTGSTLRSALATKLPDYMIPSVFVRVETLPLASNGKVNRLLLPEPGSSRPELDTPCVAPRTLTEKQLASIWAKILSLDEVGVHDNFFELGGHSLAVTRVLSQIIEQFQLEIPIRYFFQYPTVAALADYIGDGPSTSSPRSRLSVRSVARGGRLPLSFSQERLWFLDQLGPGGYTYNLLAAYQLKGRVDITALEQSVNEIIKRHEILRTVFKSTWGKPEQIILPSMALKIPLLDLRNLASPAAREREVRRLSKQEAQRPFDLTCGPLLRMSLLQLTDDEYLLFRAVHHIVIDDWSGGVLFRELAQFYEAFSKRQPLLLADLPIQYADFALWQRQRLQGELLERQVSYWKKQLDGIPAVINLPTDRPRPAVESYRGTRQSFKLPEKLTRELKSLSREHDATLFMTLLAAFQTLLYRYTGQDDIVVGSPIANRSRSEIEGLIGFFVNTLVLRSNFADNPTFRDLLARVREVALQAYAHQDLPFEKLVGELNPERNPGRSPLFQVMFVLQDAPATPREFGGLTVGSFAVDSETAKFDLTLSMREEAKELRGSVEYSTDLFDRSTISRMFGHLETLLREIVADPDQRISDLPLLTEAEKQQLLVEWNETRRDYPKDKCTHELFEIQVERTPDAIALVFRDQQVTYRELNKRANQLAHYLRRHSVGPEVLVGICLGRSIEMVVALLGILKAGGAYVPLDPDYPKERFGFTIEDAQVRVVLTQENLIAEKTIPCDVVCLDRDWQEIARESARNPESRVSATNLAYVLYTSGSTGTPKGVMVPHLSVVNLVAALNERIYTDRNTPLRVSLNASITFDSSVKQLVQLLNGHTLCIVPEESRVDGQALLSFMSRHKLDVLDCTPAQARLLVEAGLIESSQHIAGLILVGGEAVDKFLWTDLCGAQRTRAFNLYGPTECTVDSTICEIHSGLHTALIGSPIVNVQIYVLDVNLHPVPIGVLGELHIGGEGLARGYLNRAELTAEKFIANPFSDKPGARLYRTGDLARYLPDGNIEFLGRLDDQVKIRGYRIELGEIEFALRGHPEVRQCAVMAREGTPGDKRLIGYVVMQPEGLTKVDDLRGFLKQKLPPYMIPSVLVQLDKLPLLPNGKVDRKALPAPDGRRPELKKAYMPPRTPIEQTLVEIWREILKLERVGIHDNFFDIGGHSLLATQVISRMRNALKINLPLRILFETPTIQGLAENLHSCKDQRAVTDNGRIVPVARKQHLVQITR